MRQLDRTEERRVWDRLTDKTRTIIVNTDIDGVLSAALLLHANPTWRIGGLYDNEKLWLDDTTRAQVRNRPEEVLWVDVSMCWPRCRSVSQHVVAYEQGDLDRLNADGLMMGPSISAGHTVIPEDSYTYKYPFGTFQYLWWLLNPEVSESREQQDIWFGLLWMPDGGVGSLALGGPRIRKNVCEWARTRMPGSPLFHSLAELTFDAPYPRREVCQDRANLLRQQVWRAFRYLRGEAGPIYGCWHEGGLQLKLRTYDSPRPTGLGAVVRHTAPGVDLGQPDVLLALDTVVSRTASVFGWDGLAERCAEAGQVFPTSLGLVSGTRYEVGTTRGFARGVWLEQAMLEGWVSVAFTGHKRASYTVGSSTDQEAALNSVLPQPS